MKKVLSLILSLALLLSVISVFGAEIPDNSATITITEKDGGYFTKASGSKIGILRFISKVEFDPSYNLESYGMKFIPLDIFENNSITNPSWSSISSANVNGFESGNTFSADLENISESFFTKDFLAVGYAKFEGYDPIFTAPSSSSVNRVEGLKNLGTMQNLQCDVNGDFKILLVADPHGTGDLSSWTAAATNLEAAVARTNPDLVVIHGDIYMSAYIPTIDEAHWELFIEPVESRGIPWITTNGNHDQYNDATWNLYKSYENCLNEKVSSNDANYEETRPMNYVLPIYANDGKTPVFNIWSMDTGRYPTAAYTGEYDGVTNTQIAWYKAKSAEIKAENGGKDLTGLMLLHIPPTEMIDLYYSNKDGSVATVGQAGDAYQPIYGAINDTFNGVTNYTTDTGTLVSKSAMNATHPNSNRGIFAAMKEMGNIDISISGHDHANNFIGNYKGILMGFTGRMVGSGAAVGARVVEFNQSNPKKFTTSWIALDSGEDQPKIYKDATLAK